jgi:hypothetical protein
MVHTLDLLETLSLYKTGIGQSYVTFLNYDLHVAKKHVLLMNFSMASIDSRRSCNFAGCLMVFITYKYPNTRTLFIKQLTCNILSAHGLSICWVAITQTFVTLWRPVPICNIKHRGDTSFG